MPDKLICKVGDLVITVLHKELGAIGVIARRFWSFDDKGNTEKVRAENFISLFRPFA